MSHYRSECTDCGEYAYLNDDARCETESAMSFDHRNILPNIPMGEPADRAPVQLSYPDDGPDLPLEAGDAVPGQPVWVRAFGRWRSGVIVGFGRRNVAVDYYRKPFTVERRYFARADMRVQEER